MIGFFQTVEKRLVTKTVRSKKKKKRTSLYRVRQQIRFIIRQNDMNLIQSAEQL